MDGRRCLATGHHSPSLCPPILQDEALFAERQHAADARKAARRAGGGKLHDGEAALLLHACWARGAGPACALAALIGCDARCPFHHPSIHHLPSWLPCRSQPRGGGVGQRAAGRFKDQTRPACAGRCGTSAGLGFLGPCSCHCCSVPPLTYLPACKRADTGSLLMDETSLSNTFTCQPEERNMHGRIFGGFLMRWVRRGHQRPSRMP